MGSPRASDVACAVRSGGGGGDRAASSQQQAGNKTTRRGRPAKLQYVGGGFDGFVTNDHRTPPRVVNSVCGDCGVLRGSLEEDIPELSVCGHSLPQGPRNAPPPHSDSRSVPTPRSVLTPNSAMKARRISWGRTRCQTLPPASALSPSSLTSSDATATPHGSTAGSGAPFDGLTGAGASAVGHGGLRLSFESSGSSGGSSSGGSPLPSGGSAPPSPSLSAPSGSGGSATPASLPSPSLPPSESSGGTRPVTPAHLLPPGSVGTGTSGARWVLARRSAREERQQRRQLQSEHVRSSLEEQRLQRCLELVHGQIAQQRDRLLCTESSSSEEEAEEQEEEEEEEEEGQRGGQRLRAQQLQLQAERTFCEHAEAQAAAARRRSAACADELLVAQGVLARLEQQRQQQQQEAADETAEAADDAGAAASPASSSGSLSSSSASSSAASASSLSCFTLRMRVKLPGGKSGRLSLSRDEDASSAAARFGREHSLRPDQVRVCTAVLSCTTSTRQTAPPLPAPPRRAGWQAGRPQPGALHLPAVRPFNTTAALNRVTLLTGADEAWEHLHRSSACVRRWRRSCTS
eukprot:COSAG01_NODE_3676_length_5804_cov_8.195968_4_plen_576_part_00